jgi:RIO kinase 1
MSSRILPGQFDDADDEINIVEAPTVLVQSNILPNTIDDEIESVEVSYEEDDFPDDDNYEGFDYLESSLLGGEGYVGAKGSNSGIDVGKRINLSVRVQNDITRSEKKGEKRINNCGKDDRATSEQVLDPRTRLILFKLLNNGFLAEIDGEWLIPVQVLVDFQGTLRCNYSSFR